MNKTVKIGSFTINRIGLGTNRIRKSSESKKVLKNAIEVGVNFFDTASAYTGGESEKTIGEILGSNTEIMIATKGGMHAPDFHIDSHPESLAKQLENSLRVLRRNLIDLYFLHRVDPKVPFEDQISFFKQAQEEGKIKHVGLSHVSIEQIVEARKMINVVAVENEYNLSNRQDDEVIDYCEKEGIVFVPYYPLQGSAPWDILNKLMKKYRASEAQIQLAWLLARSQVMLPIPGSLSEKHIEENFASQNIQLSQEDLGLL